jgi:Family of unknown function (DUF6131)
VSSDGDWVYIGGCNSRCIKKVRRGSADDPEITTVGLDIMVDNIMVSLAAVGVSEDDLRGIPPALLSRRKDSRPVIVLGVILILVGYLLPVPAIIATIGWILLVIGVVLLILGQVGRPVGGRRYWY